MSDSMVTLDLDVCTPEGKTWLARITGVGGRYGIERAFIRAATRNLSRSGKTGTMSYLIGPGVYESNEGRRRYGRRYWIVDEDGLREVSQDEALAALR